jgi:hypothetical protein
VLSVENLDKLAHDSCHSALTQWSVPPAIVQKLVPFFYHTMMCWPQVLVADGDPEDWELDGIVWKTK